MSIVYFFLSCIYFFLPAYFTNVAASLSKKIKILKPLEKPLDFDYRLPYQDKFSILGRHKTWRGVIFGILVGILVAWLQVRLYQFPFFKEISFFDYGKINIFLFGFLISFGASFGDCLFSFFKRRKNMKPGQSWLPFDQIDYVIGSFLFLTPYLKLNLLIWLALLFLTFFLHIIVNRIGYLLKLSESKW